MAHSNTAESSLPFVDLSDSPPCLPTQDILPVVDLLDSPMILPTSHLSPSQPLEALYNIPDLPPIIMLDMYDIPDSPEPQSPMIVDLTMSSPEPETRPEPQPKPKPEPPPLTSTSIPFLPVITSHAAVLKALLFTCQNELTHTRNLLELH